MKQIQINRAYASLNKLLGMDLPARESRDIFMLARSLQDHYAFEADRERKLVQKYGGIIRDDGQIVFQDTENLESFKQEVSEIGDLDVDIDITPVTINCDMLGDQRISPMDMMNLVDFVIFE